MSKKATPKRDAPKKRTNGYHYGKPIEDAICERIAKAEALIQILKTPGMPSYKTVQSWMDESRKTTFRSGFLQRYARARQVAADFLAAECVLIADDSAGDVVERVNTKTGETYLATDFDNIQRSRLRVDARKWYAAKLNPKRYGDKVVQEITGAEGGPVQTVSLVTDVQARLAELRAKMGVPGASGPKVTP